MTKNKEEITRQVDILLKSDINKSSQSPYNTLVWIVPKKPDSQGKIKWRMVLDFPKLNKQTIGDSHLLPTMLEVKRLKKIGTGRLEKTEDFYLS